MPPNNSKKVAVFTKAKHSELRSSGKKNRDDDEIRSQSDAGYSSVTQVSSYRHDGHKAPNGSQRLEEDDLLPRDLRSHRRRESVPRSVESLRPGERPQLVRSLSAYPYMPIYEHCVFLRRHGISVTLGPEVFKTITQQGPVEQRSMSHNYNCSAHGGPIDLHNPSPQEQQAVTAAIIFVLDCGGEVAMSGFEPQPVTRCSACSNPISTPVSNRLSNPISSHSSTPVSARREMDDHGNGARNPFQNGQGSHPGSYETNLQENIPIGLARPYETARREGDWQGHGR